MKHLAAAVLAATAVSTFADDSVVTYNELAALPVLTAVEITVNPGPQFAAVQPTGWVKFKYSSCAPRRFKAEVETINHVMIVKVTQTDERDCKGKAQVRDYDLQISSDMPMGPQVIVLNPIQYGLD